MANKPKNILFIMADQLRWDYLSCYGHPHLHTPNIDKLAERGVRFDRAYANAPICGPSRACFYTGRSMFSNGTYWNFFPMRAGEWTIADYLRPHGYRTAVAGKLHTKPDLENIKRLGIDPSSEVASNLHHGGFEPFDRDDGLHPDYLAFNVQPPIQYNAYLKEKGYDTPNPWQENANGSLDEDGNFVSGWYMRHNNKPANIEEEHSETPYTTQRAIDCIESMGDTPWCVHLSYIKPHWPYHVPAPYHDMYGPEHIIPRVASEAERENPHPVIDAFMQIRGSLHFATDEVRNTVIPPYMGMIKQIDDQIGRLMAWLEEKELLDDTMIVFTSDHGDYLGDHWLSEKDTFHEPSIRIPMIIVDPSPTADSTRGTVSTHFVEAIDLAPTFLELAGGEAIPHRLEGRSLMPLLHGQKDVVWRDHSVCETGYAGREPRVILGLKPSQCRGYMVRSEAWKYILWEGFRPQLFDMLNDPDELVDLGQSAEHEPIRREYHEKLFTWMRQRQMGLCSDEDSAKELGSHNEDRTGILIGYWSEEEGSF
ncbi:MAG: arylsulfatase A-like enzyme [Candidatus Promineifilaceae bacterium]|jgi:arylsulfatase A-like enzyme